MYINFTKLILLVIIILVVYLNTYQIDNYDSIPIERENDNIDLKSEIHYDLVHTLDKDNTYKKIFFDIFIKNSELFIIIPVYTMETDIIDDIVVSMYLHTPEKNGSITSKKILDLNNVIKKNPDTSAKYSEPIIILIYHIECYNELVKINFQYKNLEKDYTIFNNSRNLFRLKDTDFKDNTKFKLTLTTLLKDDYIYFDLFYNYYLDQGVEYFYIYYNGTVNDKIKTILNKPNVKIIEWDYQYWNDDSVENKLFHHAQTGQIHHALYKYGKDSSEYMIFCDLDEYLLSPHRKLDQMINSKKDSYIFFNVLSKFVGSIPKKFPNRIIISEEKFMYKNRSKCIHNLNSVEYLNIHYCSKYIKSTKIIDTHETNYMFHFHKIFSKKGIHRISYQMRPIDKVLNLDFFNKQLLYVHIPKTGGSFIEDTFKANGYMVGKYNKYTHHSLPRNIVQNGYKCNKWHIPVNYDLITLDKGTSKITSPVPSINFNEHLVFTVIRDPVSRFISEVNYKFFPKYYKHKESDINKFISKNFKDNTKIYDGDCHLVHQSDYIYDKSGNKINDMIKFDNMYEHLLSFIKKYHLNIKITNKKINPKTSNYKISDITRDNLILINNYYTDDINLYNQL